MNTILIAAACLAAGCFIGTKATTHMIAYALKKRIMIVDNTKGRMIVGKRQKDGSYKWRAKF